MKRKKRIVFTESKLAKYLAKYDSKKIDEQLKSVNERIANITKLLVDNEKKMMSENSQRFTGTADLAYWTPLLIPLVMRLVPQLYALNLVGVQPTPQPTGEAFAIRYIYGGNSGEDTTNTYNKQVSIADSFVTTMDIDGTTGTDALTDAVYTIDSDDGASGHGASHGVKILKVHCEDKRTLWKIVDFNSQSLADILADINDTTATTVTITQGSTDYTFSAALKNDGVVKTFFKYYTGPMLTTTAEDNPNNRQMLKIEMESELYKAKVRELGTEFSMYAYQDAMAQFGFDLNAEMTKQGSYILAREIDGEIIDAIDTAATTAGPKTFDFSTLSSHTNEITKVQTLVIALNKIAKEAEKASRVGRMNWLVCSSTAASLLESLPVSQFKPAASVSANGAGFIGVLNNRYNVYHDSYIDETGGNPVIYMGYKGQSEIDTGIVFAPYRLLDIASGRGETDFRYKSMLASRYSVVTSLYGAENYYRKITLTNVNFLA